MAVKKSPRKGGGAAPQKTAKEFGEKHRLEPYFNFGGRKIFNHMIPDLLENKDVHDYIVKNLKSSLSSIGFSKNLISDLTDNLKNLEVKSFDEKYSDELKEIYSIGFFQRLVPQYFSRNVVPEIPPSNEVLDLGCGTGILAKILVEENKFEHITGIDLHSYPEWELFKNPKITFKIVLESEFFDFLSKEKPDTATLTWVLHHMGHDEQERYIGYLYDVLTPDARLVVLEDSYSTELPPENDISVYDSFMKFSEDDRRKIMGVYDWVANKVLAQRDKVDIPLTYRTLEEWGKLFTDKGFTVLKKKFIGFPEKRDINTPQSLLIVKK
ncbi:class I SAM-dependent methyltransferase [bacterium]|nr:class I SAM-dependent methyltransferase [bacterium]